MFPIADWTSYSNSEVSELVTLIDTELETLRSQALQQGRVRREKLFGELECTVIECPDYNELHPLFISGLNELERRGVIDLG